MEPSKKFTDEEQEALSDWVEEALAAEGRFQVIPRRLRWELNEISKALGESKSQAPGDQLDGIIAIKPGTGKTVNVVAYAYANDRLCMGVTRSVAVGKIGEAYDVPRKFFEFAAKKLPDKGIDRLALMPPEVVGVGNPIQARVLGQRLQDQLADGVKQVFQTRAQLSPRDAGRPVVVPFAEGMDASQAWQANLHLSRSSTGGIEARVEFRGPAGSQMGALIDNGNFAPDILPTESDPAVREAAEAACRNVTQALEGQTDPDRLQAMAREDQCPRLHDNVVQKEKFHRERICTEDRAHVREAMGGSVEALESVARTIRCKQVADDAQKEIGRRKDLEAAIGRMKSEAADLGSLTNGQTVERKDRVADDRPGVWKFQMTEADTVEIQLGDLTANLDVDLRDASWNVVARPRQSGPGLKEFVPSDKLKAGDYYLRAAPADGKHGSAYTLRLAKTAIDTAGDTIATARDLGALGPGPQTIRKYIGGADRGDVFKFTTQDRMRLQLTVADMTSDVDLDLLNQNGQPIHSQHVRSRERQNVEWPLDGRATYYVAVKPAGEFTPYSLGIALQQIPQFSVPELAAQPDVGATPTILTHSLIQNGAEYYAKFSVKGPTPVFIDLTWGDQETELWLDLYKEESGRRLLQKRSVTQHTTSQKLSERLDPGTYFVRVKRNSGSSPAMPFKLSLRGGIIGSVREMAAPLLLGAEPVTYTLPANENDYWGRFSVTEPSQVTAIINWGDLAVDLDMELSNESGKVLATSKGTNTTRKVDPVLEPGTYLVHAHRALPTSAAAVPLRVTLSRTPAPPPRTTSSQGTPPPPPPRR
jgi:hypothetical protein